MTDPAFDAVHTLDPAFARADAPAVGVPIVAGAEIVSPDGMEPRGFALYVGTSQARARSAGSDLTGVVRALRARLADLVPGAELYASIVLAPAGLEAADLDVVTRALSARGASSGSNGAAGPTAARPEPASRRGVTIDLSRTAVVVDGAVTELTFREFELLRVLVLRPGLISSRAELIAAVWGDDEPPLDRTVDVVIRRVRDKLGPYRAVIRTVRGGGYRFDPHADVLVRHASAPSPDRF